MNLSKLFTVVGIVFASFIQVGCGTATQTTAGYMQAVNGVCQVGYTLVANNQCAPNTGVNGYNNGYNNGYAATCSVGNSYPNTNYAACQNGFVQQGSQCVCQNGLNTNVNPVQNNGCQAGTYFYQNSCYPQGPCAQGYVFYADQMCHYRQQ